MLTAPCLSLIIHVQLLIGLQDCHHLATESHNTIPAKGGRYVYKCHLAKTLDWYLIIMIRPASICTNGPYVHATFMQIESCIIMIITDFSFYANAPGLHNI